MGPRRYTDRWSPARKSRLQKSYQPNTDHKIDGDHRVVPEARTS
jgi:hypothetical protein